MNSALLFAGMNITAYVFMRGVEHIAPARKYAPLKNWTWFGWTCFVITGVTSSLVPQLVAPLVALIPTPEMFHYLHPAAKVVGSWLLLTLLGYYWHRIRHDNDFIWRFAHQLHHAPRRMDVSVSVMFHPLETCTLSLLSILVCTVIFDLSSFQAGLLGTWMNIMGMFQHWNVHTPRWVGYIIQRPESHCLHHSEQARECNFSDFPLWDMLGGTFVNPVEFRGTVGFDGALGRASLMRMLKGQSPKA